MGGGARLVSPLSFQRKRMAASLLLYKLLLLLSAAPGVRGAAGLNWGAEGGVAPFSFQKGVPPPLQAAPGGEGRGGG